MRSERQIRLTVAWWAGALRSLATDGLPSPTGSSEVEAVAAMLSVVAGPVPRPDEPQIEAFSIRLGRLMRAEPTGIYSVPATDYRPNGLLRDALTFAGISADGTTTLPQKTTMVFEGDDAYVRQLGKPDVKLE